jgi:hypothetical protein
MLSVRILGGQLGGRIQRPQPAPLVNLDEPEPELDAAALFPPGLHSGGCFDYHTSSATTAIADRPAILPMTNGLIAGKRVPQSLGGNAAVDFQGRDRNHERLTAVATRSDQIPL